MSDKKNDLILEDLQKRFATIFTLFVNARINMDKACLLMRQARLSMGTKAVYNAILDDPEGDQYLDTEQMLAKMEEGSQLLRSYIIEVERSQIKKATRNPLVDLDLGEDYH